MNIAILRFLSLALLASAAFAESPMTTVLHRPRVETAQVGADQGAALARGFARCDAHAALAKNVMAPLGVAFIDPKKATAIQFSYPNLFRDRSLLLLPANESREQGDDGRLLFYSGKFSLKKQVALSDSVTLRGVGEMLAVNPPRARVGVRYVFDQDAMAALRAMDAAYGFDLATRIDKMPKAETARSADVWITLDGRSAVCWRFID